MNEIKQRSPEWWQARLGKVTASRVADVVARTKTGWSSSRQNYMAELIVERLTGKPTEGYVSQAMQFGIDTEPEARIAYSFLRNNPVTEIGFVEHPSIAKAGCSPDGFVDDIGMVEFKVPQPATHLATLLSGTVDGSYIKQMQFQLACCPGRQWNDFVSYQPAFPEPMRLFIKRISRDDEQIAELEREVVQFLDELDDKLSRLNKICGAFNAQAA